MAAPRAFFIRNHSASDLQSAELARLPALSRRPAFATKDLYAVWCHAATTQHVFYTLAEPELPTQRSSGRNPIKFLHGIVADYDGDATAINAALPHLKFAAGKAPTWVTTTFSQKARLIWAFERPVPVFSPEVLTRLLTLFARDLGLKKILPGLDEGALIANPHTPYELGTDWRQPYGDTRLPHAVVMLALHDASEKAKWQVAGPELPLEAVAAEVARRWPGRWAGPFAEGARGIRFWDARADNPTGCTLRRDGVQAWTGECRFIPWPELLGADFVKQFRANRIGGAIDGTWFDGRSYWQRDEGGLWRDLNTESVKRHLNVLHGLSPDGKRGEATQRDVFLSWLAHFYQHAAKGKPRRGQALFIAGPKSAGKTFLNQRVIGGLMGGFQEATQYVLGQTSFNEALFFAPVWAVDDAVGSADPRMHAIYSQIVKKIVANPYQEYHAKFKKAVTFRFHGRLVVTLNEDPTSISMLPQIDGTVLDKAIFLLAKSPGVSFTGADETVAAELPYFADYVATFVIPAWLQQNPDEVTRFGLDAWHHPDLLNTAKDSGAAASLLELLDVWRTHYFRGTPKAVEWAGSAFDLYVELSNHEVIAKVLNRMVTSRNALGRDLQNMIRQGTPWLTFTRREDKRIYTIRRPENLK